MEERRYYQWVISTLMENINEYENRFKVTLFDGEIRYLLPVFCYMITDWPEGQQVCNIKRNASRSRFNCRACLTPVDEFSNTNKGLVFKRREEDEHLILQKKTRARRPYTRKPGKEQSANAQVACCLLYCTMLARNLLAI